MSVGVILPAFNEAERIGTVLDAIPDEVLGHPLHAIVVDDGSDDGSSLDSNDSEDSDDPIPGANDSNDPSDGEPSPELIDKLDFDDLMAAGVQERPRRNITADRLAKIWRTSLNQAKRTLNITSQ